jgi:hypothetical protein
VIDDEMNVSAAGEESEKYGCATGSYSDNNHTKLSVTGLPSNMFQKYAQFVHCCPKIESKFKLETKEEHMMSAKHCLANNNIYCIFKMVMA